jgi:hypothetical protein
MPIKTISEELVHEISRCYPDLRLLNLSNNEISLVENLAPLTALERLNVSGNKITALRNISCLGENLLELHAAKNQIKVADLRGLNKLFLLDISHNKLASLAELHGLSELPSLAQLMLQGNPLASTNTYYMQVMSASTLLTSLDGQPVERHQQQQQQCKHLDNHQVTRIASPSSTEISTVPNCELLPVVVVDAVTQWEVDGEADSEGGRARGMERRVIQGVAERVGKEKGEVADRGVPSNEEEHLRVKERSKEEEEGAICSSPPREEERNRELEFERDRERGEEIDIGRQCEKELERERRRSKGLEIHLADTMRLLSAERHIAAQHLDEVSQLQQQVFVCVMRSGVVVCYVLKPWCSPATRDHNAEIKYCVP